MVFITTVLCGKESSMPKTERQIWADGVHSLHHPTTGVTASEQFEGREIISVHRERTPGTRCPFVKHILEKYRNTSAIITGPFFVW